MFKVLPPNVTVAAGGLNIGIDEVGGGLNIGAAVYGTLNTGASAFFSFLS